MNNVFLSVIVNNQIMIIDLLVKIVQNKKLTDEEEKLVKETLKSNQEFLFNELKKEVTLRNFAKKELKNE